jgi:hypothetical protein
VQQCAAVRQCSQCSIRCGSACSSVRQCGSVCGSAAMCGNEAVQQRVQQSLGGAMLASVQGANSGLLVAVSFHLRPNAAAAGQHVNRQKPVHSSRWCDATLFALSSRMKRSKHRVQGERSKDSNNRLPCCSDWPFLLLGFARLARHSSARAAFGATV